jgi:MFS family permease
MGSQFTQGLAFILRTPDIRSLLLLAVTYFVFGASYMQVFIPLLAKNVMDIGESGYGWLVSMAGIGSLTGGIIIASKGHVSRRGIVLPMFVAALGTVLILLAVTASQPWLVVPFILMAVAGICQTGYQSISNGALMELTPDDMRGRVFGVHSMDRAVTTGGGAAAGFLAAAIGVQWAQAAYGVALIAVALLWAAFGASLRKID